MSFYEILGPTAAATIICLIIALVMFVIELFTPGIGVAGATGLLSLIAVVVMQLLGLRLGAGLRRKRFAGSVSGFGVCGGEGGYQASAPV